LLKIPFTNIANDCSTLTVAAPHLRTPILLWLSPEESLYPT